MDAEAATAVTDGQTDTPHTHTHRTTAVTLAHARRGYVDTLKVCDYISVTLGLIKDFVLSVWEERKVRLYGEHANVHQSHSQNDSGDLRGVAGGDGELGCLCGKAGTSHLCDGSAHSSGCVVNGSNAV